MPSLRNVVQESTDYNKFKFMTANRKQYRGHVELLKNSFAEVGNMTRVQPILVNDRYEIIDGQHRFIACKEMGLPIFYTMVDGLGVAEARSMNILHRNWIPADYARSYALSGDRNYQKYIELMEEFGVNHSIMIGYVAGSWNSHGQHAAFRRGEMVIQDEEVLRDRLEKLVEFDEIHRVLNNRSLANAFLRIISSDNYDHKRMIKKLNMHGEAILKRYSSVEDNLRQLEEVYNYKTTSKNRVRLY